LIWKSNWTHELKIRKAQKAEIIKKERRARKIIQKMELGGEYHIC
jgi:hypothetical protein